jgi:hypothetical protein
VTPTNTADPGSDFCSAETCGIASRQGGHQVAQNLRVLSRDSLGNGGVFGRKMGRIGAELGRKGQGLLGKQGLKMGANRAREKKKKKVYLFVG